MNILALMLFLLVPTVSHANWGMGYREHGYGYGGLRPGTTVSYMPRGFISFSLGPSSYYYCDGVYYSPAGQGRYIVVPPPVGAIVKTIPPDYSPMVLNGVTYYTDHDTFYVYTPQGYQVVPAPQIVTNRYAPVLSEAEIVVVSVPNDKGTYTDVTLKRSGEGFVGPQGEFYKEFPKVSQLKIMYGKS
jgi:hypothetical protein